MRRAILVLVAILLPALQLEAAPESFEQVIGKLGSSDAGTRLEAVRLLKDATYAEAAAPLASLLLDPDDRIQVEAIAAELNIFLAEKVVSRRRVALVVEVRNKITAEGTFERGPLALGPRSVPPIVLASLVQATRDENPRIGLEALYAFGTLGVGPTGPDRRDLLLATGPELSGLVGASAPDLRLAAVQVIGRVFESRPGDPPVGSSVGDAVVAALNDADTRVRLAAMEALGAMRYERGLQALTAQFEYHGRGQLADGALEAIARIAHPSSAFLFASLLTEKSHARKTLGIEGLARIGDPARLGDIEACLGSDGHADVVLAGDFARAMLAKGSIDQLAEALRDERLRGMAQQYLIEIAPGRSSLFTRQVKDPDPIIRAGVADALGLACDAAALPIVQAMRADPDAEVELAVERALSRLQVAAKR
jgi:HEAT repeat protein